ncbi:hypothetical protein AMATHDRAFT_42024 [Amanita thiersii Skay4041]|uniref:Uncharacterized protein n=1 Tax=Amanita thiersii Skay4041 TaxID=703135 RepID=A0A2A9NM16_9AGAR|nr:hypothetical protein AMATHDRAFT_42024 [Amanita thiersii Skay4041]
MSLSPKPAKRLRVELDLSNVGKSNFESYSSSETQMILQARADALQQLEKLDLELQRQYIPETVIEYEAVSAKVERFNIALAPHRKLPTEIWRHIFLLGSIDWGTTSIPYPYNPVVISQAAVSQVCSIWRQIALSTSGVWNNVEILEAAATWDVERLLYMIELWFGRSGSSLISFRCELPDIVVKTLSLTQYRFRKLDIVLTTDFVETLLKLPYKALIDLEELCLQLHKADGDFNIPLLTPPLRFPRLTYLNIPDGTHQNYWWLDMEAFELPWNNLHYFYLGNANPLPFSSILKILGQCTVLEELSVHMLENDLEQSPAPLEVVNNTTLHAFFLTFVHEGDFHALVSNLRLPNLSRLCIAGDFVPWTDDIDELVIERFNLPRIKHLSVESVSEPFIPLTLLKSALCLEQLWLPDATVLTQEILDGLSTGALGPYLNHLCIPSRCNGDAMLDMIEARQMAATEQKEQKDRGELVDGSKPITLLKSVIFACHLARSEQPELDRRIEVLKDVWKMEIEAMEVN